MAKRFERLTLTLPLTLTLTLSVPGSIRQFERRIRQKKTFSVHLVCFGAGKGEGGEEEEYTAPRLHH